MLIERPPKLVRRLLPEGLFRIRENYAQKHVYLTFDDGPIPEVTPWVLDVLDRHGVKATFFMVGDNARRHPDLVKEVMARGHAVGNHTMHHLQGLRTNTEAYIADVDEAAHYIPSRLFRPPHGWLTRSQTRALTRDYRIVMYDLVTRDYSWRLKADDVTANVKRYARPGSIIVFHDSLKSWPRLQTALPESLAWLCEQGYKFELIPSGEI